MPKEKPYKGKIAAIYKRNYEDIGMFYFVEAQRLLLPSLTIEKAIDNFYRFIGEKDFNHDSAMTTYSRMKKEFYEAAQKDC
jgi:hypothetical protein